MKNAGGARVYEFFEWTGEKFFRCNFLTKENGGGA